MAAERPAARPRSGVRRSRTAPRAASSRITTTTTNGNQSDACGLITLFGGLAEHAEDEAADHRRDRPLGPADHQRDEAGDPVGVAEVGVRVGDRADQDAGDAREDARERERADRHQHRVDADRRGHLRVECDGHADLAEQRALADELERDREHQRDADRHHLLQRQRRVADVHGRARAAASGTTSTSGPRSARHRSRGPAPRRAC